MFADVIVNVSVDALDRVFQYRVPKKLENCIAIGSSVTFPFGKGNRLMTGYVVGLSDTANWPVEKIKDLISVDEKDIPVEGQLLQLASWMKNEYGTTMNEALKTVLPIKKKIKSVEERWLNFVVTEEEAKRELDRCRLRHYSAKVRLLQGMFEEQGQMTMSVAAKKYHITKAVVDGMVKDGILSITSQKKYRNPYDTDSVKKKQKQLNEEQRFALDKFCSDLKLGISSVYLLYGVTGSGKTEVYIEMIAEVLRRGRQAIMLIPEIALTKQTVERFAGYFGNRVSILHSRMSDGEKYDQYERAKQGEIDILIGPRSALFAPFENLGLIVIDEEHEGSYKSEKPPRYHAREVAKQRARMTGASVVLGSATPSVESYYKAKQGEYVLLSLTKRAAGAQLPEVHVIDLREELKEGNRGVFSRLLQKKIEERLQRKEQCMLFINRRGYAGFVSCRSCGFVIQCPHCEVSMTAHKNRYGKVERLICHYCGHETVMPKLCPECGSPYIAGFGLGTQKVEEMLQRLFPDARILRMDGDTTTGKQGHESVLGPFREGKADILIGTQMIVKGHDLPNVTLVAALAADMSMYANDYQSMERTFDLLMQASGRAGRAGKKGEMVIQTYNPDQYCMDAIKQQKAELFYENELAYRRISEYPPFTNMVSVLVASENKERAEICIQKLAQRVKSELENHCTIIGPAEAGVTKVKDYYRFLLYVKVKEEADLKILLRLVEEHSHREEWERTCMIQYDK